MESENGKRIMICSDRAKNPFELGHFQVGIEMEAALAISEPERSSVGWNISEAVLDNPLSRLFRHLA
jgi:hypothetical protein